MTAKISILNADEITSAGIDDIRARLGAPTNPALFPPHFLKATFPKIGGSIALIKEGHELLGVAFLFPRSIRKGIKEFILRYHQVAPHQTVDTARISYMVQQSLGLGSVTFYDPDSRQQFERTSQHFGGFDVGRPSEEEARAVRQLQQKIWGSEDDYLYPADIHSTGFHAGSSLIVRSNDEPIGFGFGFYKFSEAHFPDAWERFDNSLRLESQLVGVLKEYRGRGVGPMVKKLQAENARREGIDVVSWTVDPLQYSNAVLNFAKLKAIAYVFYPDYYAFRNVLNQVPASRFGITWLVSTKRVQEALTWSAREEIWNLDGEHVICRVNQGSADADLTQEAKAIAIEVPADWTGVQNTNVAEALKWRETTDRIFAHYLGSDEGKYIITSVGAEEARRYLIAERVDARLLGRLCV